MYVTKAAGTELMLAAARSRAGAPPLGTVQPVTEAVAAWVPRQREWLDGGELDTDPPESPDPSWLPPLLSVPMLVDGRFTGLLVFEASGPPRPMRAGQIKALSVLAGRRAPPRSRSSTLLEHLRRSNDDLRKFAWAASHDLQEPLREVALNTQLLARRQGALDAESSALAEAAADGARRMLAMVQELRAFVEAGATAVDRRRRRRQRRRARSRRGRSAGRHRGQRRRHHPRRRCPSCACGKRISRRCSGGCSTTRSSSAAPAPRLASKSARARERGEWTLSVRDAGIGIDPSYHAQIFELFRRLNRREEYDGNGMGLPVCRRLVEAYGGRVWVESREGEGARFFVSVPSRQRVSARLERGRRVGNRRLSRRR